MDIRSHLDSEFLKPRINVNQGDIIKILNEGEDEEFRGQKRFILLVVILDDDGKAKTQKRFTINKTNFKFLSANFGFESKNWIGKEAQVNIVKVNNPSTGQLTDGIVLTLPNITPEGDVEIE